MCVASIMLLLFGGALVEAFALFELFCFVPGAVVVNLLKFDLICRSILSYHSLMYVGNITFQIAFCNFYLLSELFGNRFI